MKVALYGYGKLLTKTAKYIENTDGIEIVAIVNDVLNDGSGQGMILSDAGGYEKYPEADGLPALKNIFDEGAAEAVIVACENELISFVTRRILSAGIYDICILPTYYENDLYDIDDKSFIWIDNTKPRLDYIEYHISFHCNLNCKGCSHFSNLIKEPRFGNAESFRRDMERLSELFWGIGKIRLMGGEPVLNPELPQFVYIARSYFPDADIRVVSNGLMIRETDTELFKAMRECAVYFDVSMYPPTKGCISRLDDICKKEQVMLTVTPEVGEFGASLNPKGDSNPAESYDKCPARHCVYLQDGKVSTCAMPQLIDIYNDHFGCNIKPGTSDVTDIYDPSIKGIDIIERTKRPMEICRYCYPERRNFKWQPSLSPEASDWVGGESN